MLHYWNGFYLEITDFNYHHDPTPSGETYLRKPQILKHVEIIKVSEKPTYDTSFERSRLGDHRF